MKDTLGYRLKMIREKLDISRKDASGNCDITERTLSKYEKDETEPKVSDLIKLCKYYKADICWVALGDELLKDNISIINKNGNVAVNGTITINTHDYADNDEIKEVVDLLKYASKPLLDKFVEKLKRIKNDTESF